MFTQDKSIIPERYFSGNSDSDIFISYYSPKEDGANGMGILMCDPILEEKQDARRALANCANAFTQHGFGVMTFDYRGQGESYGEFSDFSPDDALSDIKFCFQELLNKPGIKKAGVFGMRYGGNLGAAAISELGLEAGFLLLWAPLINAPFYAETILRTNLATQLLIHRKVVTNTTALLEKMEAGDSVNIEGYEFTNQWYQFIFERDIIRDLEGFKGNLCLLELDPKPARKEVKWNDFISRLDMDENRCINRIVKSEMFWKLIPRYIAWPDEPMKETMEFLSEYVNRQ